MLAMMERANAELSKAGLGIAIEAIDFFRNKIGHFINNFVIVQNSL